MDDLRLNTTLTASPMFLQNALAFAIDGSVIGSTWEDLSELPAYIESNNEALI